ncbi:hypothetical protein BDK51DRAFT_26985 [Blyttiomyces helicus]|uniref:IPT/TIG domain-containing protein n=1 Tax=Blyttiomyces helicus TaxID=388810 RepID=A0A4P9WB03_9FUNG|nr:hypothetical protein BDK51DRAFT_26985 [Blyttiomyces helicus]|eukprot:RKO88713.1 hypothetical protein BDK51DRAFT_26985 [Blyttiomyces helicus]
MATDPVKEGSASVMMATKGVFAKMTIDFSLIRSTTHVGVRTGRSKVDGETKTEHWEKYAPPSMDMSSLTHQAVQLSSWTNVQCYFGRVDNVALSGSNAVCPHGLPESSAWYASSWDFSRNLIGNTPDSFFSGANNTYKARFNFSQSLFQNSLEEAVARGIARERTAFRTLYLEGNNLYGYIPTGFSFFQPQTIFLGGNNFFCKGGASPTISSIASITCHNVSVTGCDPDWVIADGGMHIVLKGDNFLNVSGIECMFGTTNVTATYINSTALECQVPPVAAVIVSVSAAFQGSQISESGAQLIAASACLEGFYRTVHTSDCVVCPGRSYLPRGYRYKAGAVCDGGDALPYPQYGFHESLSTDEPTSLRVWAESSIPFRSLNPFKKRLRLPSMLLSGRVPINPVRRMHSRVQLLVVSMQRMRGWPGSELGQVRFALSRVVGHISSWAGGAHFIRELNPGYPTTGLNILLEFIQISALIFKYPLNWPPQLNFVITVLVTSNFDSNALGLDCIMNSSLGIKLKFLLAAPFLVALAIAVISAMYALRCIAGGEEKDNAIGRSTDVAINAYLTFLLQAQIPLAKKAAEIRQRRMHSDAPHRKEFTSVFECAVDVDRSYVLTSPETTCYTDSWYSYFNIAILGCILYTLGIPVVVLALSRVYSNASRNDVEMRRFRVLFQIYRDKCWYFKGYKAVVHLMLMLTPVFLANTPVFICMVTFLIISLDSAVTVWAWPYRFLPATKARVIVAHTLLFFPLGGIASYSDSLDETESNYLVVTIYLCFFLALSTSFYLLWYEWQAFCWHSLAESLHFGPLVRSSWYAVLFPLHLDLESSKLARPARRLPDPTSRGRARYERHQGSISSKIGVEESGQQSMSVMDMEMNHSVCERELRETPILDDVDDEAQLSPSRHSAFLSPITL